MVSFLGVAGATAAMCGATPASANLATEVNGRVTHWCPPREALERAGEVDHVRLDIVEPMHRETWTVWRAGQSIKGRCRARVDIARQQWLLMLDVERGGEHTYPGTAVEVWHWRDQWRLWDAPLDH